MKPGLVVLAVLGSRAALALARTRGLREAAVLIATTLRQALIRAALAATPLVAVHPAAQTRPRHNPADFWRQ